ncbi:MAG: hypothetical protein ABI629_22785 [bacterium]
MLIAHRFFMLPAMMQTTLSADEILANGPYDAPLIANGVRCHGGFVDGQYVSPRVVRRGPAIAAWQAALAAQGVPLIEVPRMLVPPQYPNAAQSVLLLREGVAAPVVRILTTIAIIEGFGAIIRDQRVPDLSACVRQPLDGTAAAHLAGGLFEAHARDEAGFRDEGGHKQMWEAARDVALNNPTVPPDVLMRLMTGRRGGPRQRLFPQLPAALEELLTTMSNVLVIEVFAADTFQWAETVLGDAEVSRRPAEAAALVGYIRADETPHVEYLRTALSELRACTFVGEGGVELPGHEVIDALLHRTLSVLTVERPKLQRAEARADIDAALGSHPDAAGLRARFHALEQDWSVPAWDGRLVG